MNIYKLILWIIAAFMLYSTFLAFKHHFMLIGFFILVGTVLLIPKHPIKK